MYSGWVWTSETHSSWPELNLSRGIPGQFVFIWNDNISVCDSPCFPNSWLIHRTKLSIFHIQHSWEAIFLKLLLRHKLHYYLIEAKLPMRCPILISHIFHIHHNLLISHLPKLVQLESGICDCKVKTESLVGKIVWPLGKIVWPLTSIDRNSFGLAHFKTFDPVGTLTLVSKVPLVETLSIIWQLPFWKKNINWNNFISLLIAYKGIFSFDFWNICWLLTNGDKRKHDWFKKTSSLVVY